MAKSIEQLITENEELNTRLAEAEEILQAIRSGEMDAIVVSGSKGEQVYSISSAETPYRIFVEEMHAGAVTLSREGIILYCNQRFAQLVQEPVESVIGSYFIRFITPDDQSKINNVLAHQPFIKNEALTVCLINALWLRLSIHHLPHYLQDDNFILIASDITELKKKEKELLELHRLLEQRLEKVKKLRIDLVDIKVRTEAAHNKLRTTNKKLIKEIAKYQLAVTELKEKLKQKKSST